MSLSLKPIAPCSIVETPSGHIRAEMRAVCRDMRDWRRSVRARRVALATKGLPVAERMVMLCRELGVEPVEGETLSQFVLRAVDGPVS